MKYSETDKSSYMKADNTFNKVMDEVNRFEKLALEKPNKNSHWWFAGGMVAGIVTSVVIFYAAVEIGERD